MTNLTWSNELLSWAREAGYLSTFDGSDAILYSEGGENRFAMRVGRDQWYELSFASRGNSEKLRLKALSTDTLERYLLGTLGNAIRDNLGLPFVPLPFDPAFTADGYSVGDLCSDGYRYLLRDGEDAVAAARDETRSLLTLVPLSHYLTVSEPQLESFFRSEAGFPFPSK